MNMVEECNKVQRNGMQTMRTDVHSRVDTEVRARRENLQVNIISLRQNLCSLAAREIYNTRINLDASLSIDHQYVATG